MWLLPTTTLLIALAALLAISYTLLWSPLALLIGLLFSYVDPLQVPAIAVLTAEVILCCYVWVAWRRRGHGVTASLSPG